MTEEGLKEEDKIMELKYLKKYGIIAGKKIHKGWDEWDKLPIKQDKKARAVLRQYHPMGYFGKWQYLFTSAKGTISMVQLLDYNRIGEHIYEIFCLDEEGTTPAKKELDDTRRFFKRQLAIKDIIEILRTDRDEKQKS